MSNVRGKIVEIISSDHPMNWYADKVGERFIAHSECSRDKNKLVVRTTIEQAGWPHGWVEKVDCKFIE